MNPYSIFPDLALTARGPVSEKLRSLGIRSFQEACKFVHEVPYGYSSNRDDMMTLFIERRGTCTTKHAVIATLAQELALPIKKKLGIYAMTEGVVTGAGNITSAYQIPYVPMLPCFLDYQGRGVDLTQGNRNGKNQPIDEFLFTQEVESNVSEKSEYLIYRNALVDLIKTRDELKGIEIQKLLHAREEGIKLLKANIA